MQASGAAVFGEEFKGNLLLVCCELAPQPYFGEHFNSGRVPRGELVYNDGGDAQTLLSGWGSRSALRVTPFGATAELNGAFGSAAKEPTAASALLKFPTAPERAQVINQGHGAGFLIDGIHHSRRT